MSQNSAPVFELGPCSHPSPLLKDQLESLVLHRFVGDDLSLPLHLVDGLDAGPQHHFQLAGPRERVYFTPETCRAAIVTCGGLCPGLNNVIRSVFLELFYHYGVTTLLGLRYGYHGLNPAHGWPPLELSLQSVSDIHETGGTILGTSRGPEDPAVMVNYLRQLGVSILFTVGGDGTQRGALRVHEEARRQQYPLAVVGIPKTIDNDIQYVSRTFGFTTAVEEARATIDGAHTEARAVLNGVGLVKLMGRDSGFIAAAATVASGEVNYCFVPEVPFELEGENGLLAVLEKRLARKQHAMIVAAEGAGQDLIQRDEVKRDASGNVIHADIGAYLQRRIREHFAASGKPVNVRYIDPSYAIRSKKANTEDAILCDRLARYAVHAAMAGKSGLIVGLLHEKFIHVPIEMATTGRKQVDERGPLWGAVLASTGQPLSFLNG